MAFAWASIGIWTASWTETNFDERLTRELRGCLELNGRERELGVRAEWPSAMIRGTLPRIMNLRVAFVARVAAVLLFLVTPRAQACGVSASGISSCSLAEHNEAVRPRWALGVSGLYTSTRLRFSGALHADQTRYATLGTLAYLPTPRLVLQVGAGAAFGGSLTLPDGKYHFSPGPTGVLGADFLAFDDGKYFLLLTSGLSFAASRTHLGSEPSVGYQAFDLRLGTELGVQLAQLFRPYAVARVFGGPVLWRYQDQSVTGTDTHHYQIGAGVGIHASKAVNLFVEGIPLGERAVSFGVGLAL